MSNIKEHYEPENKLIKKVNSKEIELMNELRKKYLASNEIKYYIGSQQVTKQEYDNQPIEFSPTQTQNNQTLLG